MSGYYKSFEYFLEFSYAFHERNYLCDLLYLNIYEYYEKLFGKENISVFIFEEFIINTSEFTKKICKFLGIDFFDYEIRRRNQSLSIDDLENIRLFNNLNRHNLGNSLLDYSHSHRLKNYFLNELNIRVPKQAINDEIRKSELINAIKISRDLHDEPKRLSIND